MAKQKKTKACGLGRLALPKSCAWKLRVFKHNDKRPWDNGKFIAGTEKKATQRWYVLMGPGGQHRQFFQKCLAERVGAGLCGQKVK